MRVSTKNKRMKKNIKSTIENKHYKLFFAKKIKASAFRHKPFVRKVNQKVKVNPKPGSGTIPKDEN